MAESLVKEIGVEDLYGFLGVTNAATERELKKAYRKKARDCHPDKNPDNPKAAEMFQKLSRVYNVLTDPAAKGAYDKWLKIKEMVKRRNEELSAKRQKLKESLESKESEHLATLKEEHEARVMMKTQIERLREQSQEMVRRHQDTLRASLNDDIDSSDSSEVPEDVVVQATWGKGSSVSYSTEDLKEMFSKYGEVEDIVKKKTKALISFTKPQDAIDAIKNLSGTFSFKWISGQPPVFKPPVVAMVTPNDMSHMTSDDYEQQVMARLREAQKKKNELSEDDKSRSNEHC